ncbi:hypothetical protein [Paenibacillus lautus]|jgi:hypothetical protein|uniref:hypothetical protein n=1 Tax=Paenibacillus lautus TaxID=1401 RepID=UPI000FDB55D7|nr:hypothetical protein [Paenibacillus lautus]
MKNTSLSVLIFFITIFLIIIGLTSSFIWFPKKEIFLALTALGGSLAGGWLTLIGVKLTIQKSDQDKFIQTYIEKVIAIKESKDFLEEFLEEDCPHNEGEELWNIIVHKSSKFESVYQNINYIVGGELAYKLYDQTFHFKGSYIIDYKQFLDTSFKKEILGKDTALKRFLDSFCDSIEIVINNIIDEEEKLVQKYTELKKGRFLI